MKKEDYRYQAYIQILKEELIPAMGCTEPIALAYIAAKARDVLGAIPQYMKLEVSGSIIKNVKSVIVPNTGRMKGISAAIAAGVIAGKPEKELEVISAVTDEERREIKEYLDTLRIDIQHVELGHVFDIILTASAGSDCVRVRIVDYHTNIVLIEKNGEILLEKTIDSAIDTDHTDRSVLSMESIWDFAETVDIADVRELIDQQIRYNAAIADEGLWENYGANIGSILLKTYGQDVRNRAKAKAAAGSDARMNGCELPVIINSGSGNQGITVSVPVIEYAKELQAGHEKLVRALALSNLIAIHEKNGIGTLSAYCGAVSAGAAAGAGIAYLESGTYNAVIHTVVNALAIVSGIICDGAKASCAAKIAASVDAGILGYHMYLNNQEFKSGDGIVMDGIEPTIAGIGRIGKNGMKATNEEIIRLMIGM